MARKPFDSDVQVRLKSSRAPYRRAGIVFGSNREANLVDGDKLSADQLTRLRADPVIVIDLVDVATGKVTPIAAWEAAQAAEVEATEAKARARAERDETARAKAEKDAADKAAADKAKAEKGTAG